MELEARKEANGDEPVTHADLSVFAGRVDERFDTLQSDLTDFKSQTETSFARVLELLESIDEQLRNHRHLPDRVARLERSVFGRQT